MNLTMFNASYFADNEEAILESVSSEVGNFVSIIGDGGMILCRGVDATDVGADTHNLPAPLQDEGMANYHARIAVETVAIFAQVKGRAPTEAMHFSDGSLIQECRKMNGWEAPVE